MAPNYPITQQTGRLAEILVERIFTQWVWTVGKDHIDVGYDLTVEPDRDQFRGALFLVQVKGTLNKTKRGLTARVAKTRLRDYLNNPQPVFILRVIGDQVLWVDAKAWAREHPKRLAGEGYAGVRFDMARQLEDGSFLEHLTQVLTPAAERAGSLAQLARDRSTYLSNIDPGLSVEVSIHQGREVYEIKAVEESHSSNFTLRPRDSNDLTQFREAIEYGKPVTIDAEEFRVEGSPVFDELKISTPHAGKLTIKQNRPLEAELILQAHPFNFLAPGVRIPIHIYSGVKGSTLQAAQESAVLLEGKMIRHDETQAFGMTINFSVNTDYLERTPLRDCSLPDGWARLADEASVSEDLSCTLRIKHANASSRPNQLELLEPDSVLHYLGLIEHSIKICTYLHSDFKLPQNASWTADTAQTIADTYAMLKGQSVAIPLKSIQVIGSVPDPSPDTTAIMTTEYYVYMFDQKIGTIPVIIDCKIEKLTRQEHETVLHFDTAHGSFMRMGTIDD